MKTLKEDGTQIRIHRATAKRLEKECGARGGITYDYLINELLNEKEGKE